MSPLPSRPTPWPPASPFADTREQALAELHLIADLSDSAVTRSDSAQLIDEMLQEISYGDVA